MRPCFSHPPHFITTALTAAGGLALGVGIAAPAQAASLNVRPWGDDAKRYPGEVNAWVVIEPDDTVIIRYGRSEMGKEAGRRCRKFSPKSSNAIGPWSSRNMLPPTAISGRTRSTAASRPAAAARCARPARWSSRPVPARARA